MTRNETGQMRKHPSAKAAFIDALKPFQVNDELSGHIYNILEEAGCITATAPVLLLKHPNSLNRFHYSPEDLVESAFDKYKKLTECMDVSDRHLNYSFSRRSVELKAFELQKTSNCCKDDGKARSTSANAKMDPPGVDESL